MYSECIVFGTAIISSIFARNYENYVVFNFVNFRLEMLRSAVTITLFMLSWDILSAVREEDVNLAEDDLRKSFGKVVYLSMVRS